MNKESTPSYVYNIEVLVKDNDHSTALIQLLQQLNKCGFEDYKIISGIQLGHKMDELREQAISEQKVPIRTPIHKQTSPMPAQSEENGFAQIRRLMKKNTLIRLIVNKGLGIKMSIPCRIINFEEKDGLVTVYHVDEKQVYTFRLTEIEDFVESK